MTAQVFLAVWAALALALVGCEAAALMSHDRERGFVALLSSLTASRRGTIIAVVGWMWLGWHLFAR